MERMMDDGMEWKMSEYSWWLWVFTYRYAMYTVNGI